jgi:DNA-binding MltR family transcriptional regulator
MKKETFTILEREFELPKDFLLKLVDEDDWSFIIKCHALLEAAVSQLITHNIGDTRLLPIFERLELSNNNTGKVAFLKSLGLLNTKSRSFIQCMSELRNQLVHNIKNVKFRIKMYYKNLNAEQKKKWMNALSHWTDSATTPPERAYYYEEFKWVVWHSTVLFLIITLTNIKETRSKAEYMREQLKLIEKHLPSTTVK